MKPVAYITEEMVQYAKRYGGMCRDCADENGICPTDGIACGGKETAVRFAADAINYGIKNGFIANPFAAKIGGRND